MCIRDSIYLALFVNARHREHAKLPVVQQLTVTVVIATVLLLLTTVKTKNIRSRENHGLVDENQNLNEN